MSRRKAAPKRKILPDPKFKNLRVAKFMNQIMNNGKKALAETIVYGAFEENSNNNTTEVNSDDENRGVREKIYLSGRRIERNYLVKNQVLGLGSSSTNNYENNDSFSK